MLRDLYEGSQYKNIVHNIDGLYIPLDLSWKRIGVSVSGGADSALLLYILCDLITKNKLSIDVHVITNIRMWKLRPWQEWIAKEVYRYFVNRFPNIRFRLHENFIPPDLEWGENGPNIVDEHGKLVSGDIIETRSFAEYVSHKESLDAYYNAVTRNPPVELDKKMSMRDVDPTKENFHLAITEYMDTIVCHPFRFTAKDWVVKQYKQLNIDNLFNITRSCEGDTYRYPHVFNGLDYKNYVPGQYVPVCNGCYWCFERNWAIEQSK